MKSFSGGDKISYLSSSYILVFKLQEKSKILFLCECAFLSECSYFIQEGRILMACSCMLNSWLVDEKVSHLICQVLKYLI